MKPSLDITKDQKTKIHIAKSAIGLGDEDYRNILSGFNNKDMQPCISCSQFTYVQAEALLNIFKNKFGWKEKRKYKNSKYAQYAGRDAKFASVAQLELIDYKWFSNSNVREKTDEALNHFIKNIAKVDHLSFLLKKDVSKVIKAIGSLKPLGESIAASESPSEATPETSASEEASNSPLLGGVPDSIGRGGLQ